MKYIRAVLQMKWSPRGFALTPLIPVKGTRYLRCAVLAQEGRSPVELQYPEQQAFQSALRCPRSKIGCQHMEELFC